VDSIAYPGFQGYSIVRTATPASLRPAVKSRENPSFK
jgi:hypothetical protein